MRHKLLIIKTGATFPFLKAHKGDFEHWIIAGLGLGEESITVVDVQNGALLPAPEKFSGAVVTGSPEFVTAHHPWSERTAAWLRQAVQKQVPVLGICYGHQLLAYALGGVVEDNPHGYEIGTVAVRLTETAGQDKLLGGFDRLIRVHQSHSQSVLKLPAGARLLAWNEAGRHQAFVVGDNAWGVQFHPEFDADVVRAYIDHYRQELRRTGQDPDRLLQESRDTPYGPKILQRFASLGLRIN